VAWPPDSRSNILYRFTSDGDNQPPVLFMAGSFLFLFQYPWPYLPVGSWWEERGQYALLWWISQLYDINRTGWHALSFTGGAFHALVPFSCGQSGPGGLVLLLSHSHDFARGSHIGESALVDLRFSSLMGPTFAQAGLSWFSLKLFRHSQTERHPKSLWLPVFMAIIRLEASWPGSKTIMQDQLSDGQNCPNKGGHGQIRARHSSSQAPHEACHCSLNILPAHHLHDPNFSMIPWSLCYKMSIWNFLWPSVISLRWPIWILGSSPSPQRGLSSETWA